MFVLAVGTPLFAAPEIMNGSKYDQMVDVYSYGLVLMTIAVDVPILDFITRRWCVAFGKKKVPTQPLRVLNKMNDGSWRPVTTDNPIAQAPPTINSLIIRCCDHNPDNRPSFNEILHELSGVCKEEIDNCIFTRKAEQTRVFDSVDANEFEKEVDTSFNGQGVELGLFDSMEASASSRLERRLASQNPLRLSSVLVSTSNSV